MKFLGAELTDQEDKYHWTVNKQKPENKQFSTFFLSAAFVNDS